MKRTFFSTIKLMSLALLAAASLLTSCEEDPVEEPVGKKEIKISASINDFTGGSGSAFEEGAAIGVNVVTDRVNVNNAKFTLNNGVFAPAKAIYWPDINDDATATLFAYYPHNSKFTHAVGRVHTFAVKADQSTKENYSASDLMVGATVSKPTSKVIDLSFQHMLSKMVLSISSPTNETVESVTVSGLHTEASVSFQEATVAVGEAQEDVTPAKVKVDGKDAWAFIVIPQESTSYEVVVKTVSGKNFIFSPSESGIKSFDGGKAYAAELVLNKPNEKVLFNVTIADWVAENEGAMEFDRVENDIVIVDNYTIDDIDPNAEWPLIATLPSIVTPDMTTDFVVVVNTQGSGVTPGETLYAHTGVITTKSTSGSDWKYTKHDWEVDAADCRLTHVGNGIYGLVISGGAKAFYGVPEGEEVEQLAFVFRTSGGKKEVKDNGKDIYIELAEEGALVVSFVSPAHGEIVALGDVVTAKVAGQSFESMVLTLNGSEVASTELGEIVYEHTVTEVGDIVFEATAYGKDGESVTESVTVAALGATENAARPAGAKEGVTVEGSEATVVLYAPGKGQIVLLGDFNEFAPSNNYLMKRDGDYFWTTVSDLKPNTEYAYQFLVDGSIRVGDPYCEKILDPWNDPWINYDWDEATQSKVAKAVPIYPDLKEFPANATDVVSVFSTTPEQYNWQVTDFKRPNRHSLVIYELLIRDFTEEGSIRAVIDRLDYLETLGVNAIELLPIQEFDGNDSWGYNPCFYFAPDKAYGTKADYKEFIDECHKRGIAVILDVVFNHTTGQFPWAKMWWDSAKNCTAADNPFFNVDAPHNWSVYHDLKHTYPKTRSYIKEVLAFWLKEYNIDGYRFDLTKGIVQNPGNYDAGGYSSQRIGWLKEYADAIRSAEGGDDAYIIFEHFCDQSEENELAAYKQIMLWSNSAMTAMQESAMGWHENNKSNFSSIRKYGRINFAESHDEERVAYKMSKYGDSALKTVASKEAANQLSGMYALAFLSPYPKMIWQFGELAYDYSIEENGRTGRKPIPWTLGYFENTHRKALYDNLSKIISWRTDHAAIFSHDAGDTQCTTWNVGENSKGGKTLVLSNNDGAVIVVANQTTGSATTTVNVPKTGEWTNIITGQKVNLNSTYTVALGAHEFVALGKAN